ncbi:MAG: penicillin-binding transpeptidase domain-containing protein, partial [bacterium]|nr:penicillin-binding transpeptidase domain-containing protein [bacterium]
YFSKPLNRLTLSECAVLAGIPKDPNDLNPFKNIELSRKRRDLVLYRMRELGWISEKDYQAAKAEPIVVRRSTQMVSPYPSFISALKIDLGRVYNLTRDELNVKGLRITTTLDVPIQDACDKALREGLAAVEKQWQAAKPRRRIKEEKDLGWIFKEGTTRLMRITRLTPQGIEVSEGDYHGTIPRPENPEALYHNPAMVLKEGELIDVRLHSVNQQTGRIEGVVGNNGPVQGAIVVLDAHTGEVLALVGGTVGEWNRAMQGGRQAGSSFKPFFYAAALERGFQPNSIVVDEPIEFTYGNQRYRPTNYEREGFFGPMTLIQAIEESRNVATIRLYETLGIKKALAQVERFNVFNLGHGWAVPPEISSCLGTMDCSPLEMAAAYQIFANGGIAIRPRLIRNALDSDGRIELPPRRMEEPIINPVAAYQMTYMLRQVVAQAPNDEGRLGGTGYGAVGAKFPSPPYPPISGKTGTTTNNIDAWFCGFTPDLVIICQVGFDDRTPMGPGLTGGKVAGPMWAAAFAEIHKIPGRVWMRNFPTPEGLEVANICAETGKRAGPLCYQDGHRVYTNVPFPAGQAPTRVCDGSTGWPIIEPVGGEYAYLAGHSPRTGLAHAAYGAPASESSEGDSDY